MTTMRGAAAAAATAAHHGTDEVEDEEWEVEQRRREYLRRHREMLLQNQRLETERRLQEHERDNVAIQKRLDDVRAAKQHDQSGAAQNAHSLTSAPSSKQQHTDTATRLPGIYAHIDELSTDALRVVAEQQALSDMAPLNTRGKYHTRFMRDRYPIAGTQFKLERERELYVAAKKKLLLESSAASRAVQTRRAAAAAVGASGAGASSPSRMHKSLSLGSSFGQPYRNLDFYVDKMAGVLKTEEKRVEQAHAERQIRLIEVQHELGLRQFWTLFHAAHNREVVAWLKAHSFLDVNVPVRLVVETGSNDASSSPSSSSSSAHQMVQVVPDRVLGTTPLMAACKRQCVEMVSALFEQGAVAHLVTANGDSALHFVWRQWLASSAKTSSSSGGGAGLRAVVELSVRAKSTLAILAVLIANGADVNAQNDFGETALQVCARFGLEECATLLLTHGADAFARDRHGKSAIEYASEHDHEDLRCVLLNYDTIERVRAHEAERRHCEALLKRGRGVLSGTWSQSPETLLARLEVHQQRAGYLRNQFVDRAGHVLVCDDDDGSDSESGGTRSSA